MRVSTGGALKIAGMKLDHDSDRLATQADPVTLRCAKCKHRLTAAETTCSHCGWIVDAVLAAETARTFDPHHGKKHRHHSRHRISFYVFMILGVVVGLLLLLKTLEQILRDLKV